VPVAFVTFRLVPTPVMAANGGCICGRKVLYGGKQVMAQWKSLAITKGVK
jgi:hypothetical protein